MATIGEMIVRLLADTSNFNASMDEAAAKVTASNDAMAASMATSMQSFRDFDAITKESVKSTEGLAEAQAALQAVQQTGAFTSEELAAKQALVDAAMAKVGTETQAASGALSMFTRNSRTMYSTSALITDAMTGQFSRMRREVAALGNETGIMAQAFRFALSPMGLVTAALAAAAALAIKAHDAMRELEGGLEVTGNAAKLSKSDLDEMSAAMQTSGLSAGRASDALDAIIKSGKFTAAEFVDVGTAAGAMADMTGTSVDKVVGELESMASGTAKSIAKVNEKYNFLSVAQAKQIKDLIDEGHSAEAAAMAYRDLAAAMAGRDTEFNKTGNWFDKWKAKEGTFWSAVFNGGDQANEDAKSKLGDLSEVMNRMAQNSGAVWGKAADGTVKLADAGRLTALGLQQANSYLTQYNALTKEIASNTSRITDNTNAANKAIESANAVLGAKGPKKGGGIGDLETQFKEQEAAAHRSYDQMKQDAADFWNAQATDSKNSAAVQADAWQKYIDARHQLDAEGLRNESEADRKSEEATLKAAEVAKRAAEERARAEKQASQEIQQEIQKENALQLQNAEGEMQIAKKQIDIDRQALQDKYDAHQISAAQMLQGELKLDDELLASELQYLNRKKALDAGDVAAVAKDQQQITLAIKEAEQRRLQDEDRALKQSEQHWKQYSQRIAGAFQNSINSMLFQGQTLKNGLASVAESILETFLENVVEQPLQAFIAAEGQKLAAAIGFGAQKTATENAQRAANAAADVADKSAGVVRAAGLAGAQGVASFAAAPWPIDIGAPVFGAAMAAEALAFGSMASAARGWERVPADGMVTELHRDEMVLPKHVADPMRQMARNGGGNGGGAIHIHAADAASFKDFLRRNPGVLAGGMRYAAARGHF